MAIRDDFAPGEVLTSADLNDTFASKLPYSYGTATPSTSVDGFLWYDSNSTPPAPKFWDGAAFQAFAGGKLLQIQRGTDTSSRSTTSTSFVDVSGFTVSITPTKTTSAVILVATFTTDQKSGASACNGQFQITDSSNNTISGAEASQAGLITNARSTNSVTLFAYATPATTSPVTYKVRFRTESAASTTEVRGDRSTSQLYALEIGA